MTYINIREIPPGRCFATVCLHSGIYHAGYNEAGVIIWTKAPKEYDPTKCILLPDSEMAEALQSENETLRKRIDLLTKERNAYEREADNIAMLLDQSTQWIPESVPLYGEIQDAMTI